MQQHAVDRTRRQLVASTALMAVALPARAQAQTWRIVSGYPPGGSTDKVARIVAERLQAKLGATVIVENRPGAGGRLAAQQLKSMPADQRVLMIANPAVMVVAPLVFKDNGYDPQRDFRIVSRLNDYDFALTVGAAVPVRELSHLMAWLRANPDKANFGVPATGSLPHFFALMLGEKARVNAQVVGYKGSGPLITDLIGGQVPVSIDTFETVLPFHESGRVRTLAVSGARRSPFAPSVPTFKEAGIDVAANGWNALFAPASLPEAEIDRISRAVHEVMKEEATQRLFREGKLTPVVATRQESEAALAAYRKQWGPAVTRSGYQP